MKLQNEGRAFFCPRCEILTKSIKLDAATLSTTQISIICKCSGKYGTQATMLYTTTCPVCQRELVYQSRAWNYIKRKGLSCKNLDHDPKQLHIRAPGQGVPISNLTQKRQKKPSTVIGEIIQEMRRK